MSAFKFSNEHKVFITNNIKNTEKDLVNLFNKKFNANINLSQLGNFKRRNNLKSGLVGGQFLKGNVPANKGTKGLMKANKTSFKKGNIPKNYRPVGSERINKDGYIEIKVADPNKWKLKHRCIWEEAKGIVPKGHKIIFLDGNKLNISLDNLQIVSNNEELKLNQQKLIFNNSSLTSTGILLVKLQNKLKQRSDK